MDAYGSGTKKCNLRHGVRQRANVRFTTRLPSTRFCGFAWRCTPLFFYDSTTLDSVLRFAWRCTPLFFAFASLVIVLMHDGVRPVESSRASHGSEYGNRGNRNKSCVPCVSARAHGREWSGLATLLGCGNVMAHGTKRSDLGVTESETPPERRRVRSPENVCYTLCASGCTRKLES